MISNVIINKAIDFILTHIEEEISLDDVANYCGYSKYHFIRLFKAETGESVYEFIKRLKLEQSAFRLKVERMRSITEIGEEYGYSASNYSSAFKNYHNITPVQFRKEIYDKTVSHPFFHMDKNEIDSFEECNKKITIEKLSDICVLYERYKGNYHSLSDVWDSFTKKYQKYFTPNSYYVERTFDDPSITNPDDCLYDVCLRIPPELEEACKNENTCIIKGGKFAVYHFSGTGKQIYAAYQNMFTVWLPKSGCKIDERYSYDIYRSINCETGYMVIDICIPIK